MADAIKNAAMGIKRMGVIFWCVGAIVLIIFLALSYGQPGTDGKSVAISDGILYAAITVIGTLGGVDVWKQGKIAKMMGEASD